MDVFDFDEWEIENFSCWSKVIHGDAIQWKISTGINCDIELYPKGVCGKGENLVVRIHKNYILSGSEVSFIGSDGSVICMRQPEPVVDSENWINFTGPKFEEVVAGIGRNEPRHKDRLILRWKISERCFADRYYTLIEASSQFFQIKPEIFDSNHWRKIFEIYNGLEVLPKISLNACKTALKDPAVKFRLISDAESKFVIRTSIWMGNDENMIPKYEDVSIFDKNELQKFPPSVPFKELFEKGFLTIMRCKVMSGRYKYYRCTSDYLLSANIVITDFSRLSLRNMLENISAISNSTRESVKRELKPENSVTDLSKDLMCIYQENEFSDLELRCGSVTFPTHRVILSARSPVFKAMLLGNMKEAASGHVEVDDLDPHTLGRFISFLYSGTTGEEALQWAEASKLYYAADKYQVPSLKEECAVVLRNSVALENVCDILSLADRHRDEDLRSVVHEFFLKNFDEVLKSQTWEKFMLSDSILAVKTLTDVAKSYSLAKKATN